MNKEDHNKIKKPIYKRIWFWIIIVLLAFGVIGNLTNKKANTINKTEETSTKNSSNTKKKAETKEEAEAKKKAKAKEEDIAKKKAEAKKKADANQFYVIDKFMDEYNPDNKQKKISLEDYNDFAKNALLLEGVIGKYGAPSQSTQATKDLQDDGNKITVAYPTNEKKYSAVLTFTYKMKKWLLTKKEIVENKGINLYKYTYKK